jgi:hypothetical protein
MSDDVSFAANLKVSLSLSRARAVAQHADSTVARVNRHLERLSMTIAGLHGDAAGARRHSRVLRGPAAHAATAPQISSALGTGTTLATKGRSGERQ